jgi:hypothetical protein
LILFFINNKKRDIYDIFSYWIKSKNEIFKLYCDYKILSLDKFYKKNDYKETVTLFLYLIGLMSILNEENKNKINIIDNDLFKMKINKFNEYRLNDKAYINNLIFENINENEKDNKDYNKIAIFSLDNNKNYFLQDIIDINDFKRFNKKYEFKTNKDLFFVPLKNINTYLYSFDFTSYNNNKENIYYNYYEQKKAIEYDNLKKYENLPKYSWNFGYGNKNYLLLSEENNQIYTFNEAY